MENRLMKLLSVALIVAMVMVGLVVAYVYYYYTAQIPVLVETPKIQWAQGTDASNPLIGTNSTWCQISLGKLEPNATTVYTDALNFTVLSASTNMKLEITSVTDTNTIIWGIRFYIYQSGASSSTLTLVDGATVSIPSTNGGNPVDQVGYRQSSAPSGYGSTLPPPVDSNGFTGTSLTTYIIAVEAYGKDGILTTQSATIELSLIWS
jgi:hypothetical protein